MGKPRIFLHDKIYIPVTEVSEKRVVKEYTHYEFDDNICRGCPMRHQRPCADCRECEWGGLKTSFLLANRKTNNGKAYYTIPMGDFENVERKLRIDFDDFKVVDRTKRIPFDYPIKFTAELYDYQEEPVKRIKRFKMGILKSKPRTGKCVVGSEMVDTSCGLLDMRALWKEFGDDSKESVELSRMLTTNTAYGSERISWIHRKKSKTIAMTSHIGHELAATPEHPVFVVTPDLQVEERRMDELRIGDWIVSIPNTSKRMRHAVKLTQIPESAHRRAKSITQPTLMSDDLAYVLGCLVANGSLASARTTNAAALRFSSDDFIVSKAYASKVESLFGVEAKTRNSEDRSSEVVVYSSQLVDWLAANGLSMTTASGKSIPECVLRSGRGIHRAFLSGYLSCDCSVYDNFIEQTTASKVLHKQLAVMFMSLGCVANARVTHKAATNGSGIKRPYYCLTLTANNRRKLMEQVQITKRMYISRSTTSKEYSDSDVIPHVVTAINALGRKGDYYEGKPSQNKHGNLARNTLLRVKREKLPKHMQDFLSYADGVFFQRVDKLEHRDSDWVYDLTVEGSHTFVASGFMVHNTIMSVAAMCKLGLRTIIMADQKDFLDGFYETIEQMTNLPALEEKTGRKLFGFPKKLEDFENFQVVLVTYQSLIKNTSVCKKRLKALRKNYGALFVDEVHRTCAPEFTKVLGKMTTRVRIGLSATPRRKDCVVKGSAVVMADGSRKAIEDVAVGDLVTSFNIAEGAFEPKPVVMTHAVQTAKRRVRVRHASGVLECTEDHEVWTANRGYVKAIDLTTSDVIQLGDD